MNGPPSAPPPRLVPERAFPPYAYLPRVTPHPVRDPQGHSYGIAHADPAPPDPDDWRACDDYLYGIDLFNHGYHWEAHEAWEALWHVAGRGGTGTGLFLQALINLAAAGFQARRGNTRGRRANARTALRLLDQAGPALTVQGSRYMGLDVAVLRAAAVALSQEASSRDAASGDEKAAVFDLVLVPE